MATSIQQPRIPSRTVLPRHLSVSIDFAAHRAAKGSRNTMRWSSFAGFIRWCGDHAG
jgi:hypothetical protein